MKHELQRIISGKSQVRNGAAIQAAASYLKGSQRTSNLAKESKLYKKQETEVLKEYITRNKAIHFVTTFIHFNQMCGMLGILVWLNQQLV